MTDPPPITRHGDTVTMRGEAARLLYRATLALLARHRLDGIVSPPLLHEARTVLFRATTMSPPRHKDAGHTIGSTQSNGQEACDWLSVGEAAALLQRSRRTVQRMAAEPRRGGLETIRVGRTLALRKAPVLALADRRRNDKPPNGISV
jgi:excisionase family DNA binding protein